MSKTTKTIASLGLVASLGLATLPLGAFTLDPTATTSDDSRTAEVEVNVDSAIALSLNANKVSKHMNTKSKDESMTTVATVSTNDTDGYKLTVKDSDTTTALKAGSYHINAGTTITAGTEGWAIKSNGGLTNYTAMVPSSATTPVTVRTHSGTTASNETTTITYGVSTRADQETGTYTDTIVYTAAVI